jgi:hypothetical protein
MKKTNHTCYNRPSLLKAVLLAMLVFVGAKGVAQEWLWAQSVGSSAYEGVNYIVKDQSNNVYVGMFLSSDGGGGTLHFNTGTYVCNGSSDMFIVKYDPDGNELWVRQLGGDNPSWPESYSEYMTGLKYDAVTNSLYVTGIFYESCNFGNGIVLDGWYQDIFYARFDPEGNCLWAKRAGSSANEYASAIGTDEMGTLLITVALTKEGDIDNTYYGHGGYLLKYSPDGNNILTKKIHNDTYNTYPAVNIREIKSKDGLIYLYGNNKYTIFSVDTISCNHPGYYGEILVCLNSEGSALWLKQFGGPVFRNISLTFAMDDQKNFYFTGSFEGDLATFGNDTIISNASSRELFIFKCDSEGNNVWIQQANASNSVLGNGIFISDNEDVFCIGSIKGNATFGEHSIQSLTMKDIFLVRYNSSGICLSAEILGEGTGLSGNFCNDNAMIVGGAFLNTIAFGNTVLTSNGYYDAFIAKRELITGNGNNDKVFNERLLIYANPSTGICNISIPEELQHEENLTLLVYDYSGKLILQKEINMQEEKISLNLQAEAKGVYNAILTNGKQKYQGKVVFE